jgi:two-component system, NtrC family, sensor kinase
MGFPLEALIEKIRRAGDGDLSGPLEVANADQLSQLASALNRMCDRLAIAREGVRSETHARIAAIREDGRSNRAKAIERLASGIAHELGTPMNVVSVRAELIMEEASFPDAVASAKVIRAQIDTMAGAIRRLLEFARRRPPQKQQLDLGDLVARTCESIKSSIADQSIQFQYERSPGSLSVEVDGAQIEQVVSNLAANALQALPNGGNVSVSVERGKFRPPTAGTDGMSAVDCALIQVKDDGVGISRKNLEQIFDPFFTLRRSGAGTGLGLTAAACIVEDHGGWIEVDSEPGRGACFSVYLPLPERLMPLPDGRVQG